MKTNPLGVFYEIPSAHRQHVEKVATNDGNVFKLSYIDVFPGNAYNFIMESKSIGTPKNSPAIEDAAWKDLLKRSQSKYRASNKQPVYAINIRDTLFHEDEPWNFNNFGCEHSIIHGHQQDQINGIQNSYINIGMLFTSLCIVRTAISLQSTTITAVQQSIGSVFHGQKHRN